MMFIHMDLVIFSDSLSHSIVLRPQVRLCLLDFFLKENRKMEGWLGKWTDGQTYSLMWAS